VRTDDFFRQANEQIRQAAEEHAVDMRVRFICECADQGCSEIIVLSLPEYRAVRAGAARFLNKAVDESADPGVVNVVGRHDGYVVVGVGAHDAH
jgi:hypothetical protein